MTTFSRSILSGSSLLVLSLASFRNLVAQATPPTIRVFVPTPDAAADSVTRDFAALAWLTVRFALARVPSTQLSGNAAPACDAGTNPAGSAVTERSTDFFVVRMEARPLTNGSYGLESDVARCRAGSFRHLFHDDATVALESVGSDVPEIGRRIADKISYEARTPVTLRVMGLLAGLDSSVLRRSIEDGVRRQPTLRPTDTASADMIVARFASARRSASFSFAGGTFAELDSFVIEGIPAQQSAAASMISSTLSSRLRTGIYGAATGQGTRIALSRDSAVARARKALCLGEAADCRADPAAATIALRSMTNPVDPLRTNLEKLTDVEIITLVGYTRLRSDDRAGAFAAFRRALALLNGPYVVQAGAALTRRLDSTQASLKRALGDLYVAEGNHVSALDMYEDAFKATPKDTGLAVQLIRTLHASGRPYDAFVRATTLAGQFGPPLQSAAVEALDGVESSVLLANLDDAKQRCTGARIDAMCADVFARRGSTVQQVGYASDQAQRFFAAASRPGTTDTVRLINAQAARAAAAIGTVSFPFRSRLFSIEATSINRGQVTAALATIDTLLAGRAPTDTLISRVRASQELSLRLRGILAALDSHYDSAMALAAAADRIIPNPRAGSLGLQVAYVAFAHATNAADSLARRTAARELLRSVMTKYPKDDAILTMASLVCGEIDIDFACAYRVAKARREYSRNLGPRARLELTEAAILDDHYDVAHDWVDDVKPAKTEYCERALSGFFDIWADYGRDKPDHAARKKAPWKNDVEAYWALPSSSGACWSFGGVRLKLAGMSDSPIKADLTSMLAAMSTKPAQASRQ